MTSKLIVVTEIDLTQGCEHTRYFVFPLDGDSDFCYRSRVSHDAFFSSPKGRNYFPTKRNAKLLYHAQDEFNFFLGSAAKAVPEQAVRLNSLWDFYEAIGYDYKQKKWSKL